MISQDRAQAPADAVAEAQDTMDTMHRALSVHAKAIKTLLEEIEQETCHVDKDRVIVITDHGRAIWSIPETTVVSPAFRQWLDSHPRVDLTTPPTPSDDAADATYWAEYGRLTDSIPVAAQTVNHKAISFDLEVLAGHQLHAWITANPGRFGYTSITSDEYISFSPEVRALLTERGILVERPVMSNGRPTAVGSGRWSLNLAGAHAFLGETSGAASPPDAR
jgi:hypothetical protein